MKKKTLNNTSDISCKRKVKASRNKIPHQLNKETQKKGELRRLFSH